MSILGSFLNWMFRRGFAYPAALDMIELDFIRSDLRELDLTEAETLELEHYGNASLEISDDHAGEQINGMSQW